MRVVPADRSARNKRTLSDFLDWVLAAKTSATKVCSSDMLFKFASLYAIKISDDYKFWLASGACKKQFMELTGLVFIEWAENIVFLG